MKAQRLLARFEQMGDGKTLFGSWIEAVCSDGVISFQQPEHSIRNAKRIVSCFPLVFVAAIGAMFLALLSWIYAAAFVVIFSIYAIYKQKLIGEERFEPLVYFHLDINTNRIVVQHPTRQDEQIDSFDIDQILEFYSSTWMIGDDPKTTIFCVDKQDIRLTLVDNVMEETGGKELASALSFLCNCPATLITNGTVTPSISVSLFLTVWEKT